MMTVAQMALLAVGLATVAVSAVGVLVTRNPYLRLHFLAPASTIGVPAIVVAAMLAGTPGRPTVKLAAILIILLLTSPVVTMAVGRARAQQDGRLERDHPR